MRGRWHFCWWTFCIYRRRPNIALYLFPVLRWENASEKIRIRPVCGSYCRSCICLLAVMPWQVEKAVGNEQLLPFGAAKKDENFNAGILNDFADYFADHFGFRHEMITLNDWLRKQHLRLTATVCCWGKDSWLFYKSTLRIILVQIFLQPDRAMRLLMRWG